MTETSLPTARIRLNQTGAHILRSLIHGQINRAREGREAYQRLGDADTIRLHDEYLRQLRVVNKELTKTMVQMGWLEENVRDEG